MNRSRALLVCAACDAVVVPGAVCAELAHAHGGRQRAVLPAQPSKIPRARRGRRAASAGGRS